MEPLLLLALLGAHDERFGRGTRIIYDVYRRP